MVSAVPLEGTFGGEEAEGVIGRLVTVVILDSGGRGRVEWRGRTRCEDEVRCGRELWEDVV